MSGAKYCDDGMRDELKYVLPIEELPRLRHAIEPFVRLDEYGKPYRETGYTVRSIYLDSSSMRFYHEKIGHLQHRQKVRVRGYNDATSTVYLEVKRKSNAAVWKDRAAICYGDLHELFRTGLYEDIAGTTSELAAVARRVCYHLYKDDLRPTSLVVYEREAFQGRFDDTFRITLDKNIRSAMYPDLDALFSDDGLVEALPGRVIMEVKFSTRLPAWMRQILAEFGLMQRAASKYCLCIDSFERRVDTKTAVLASAASASTCTRTFS